MSRSTPQRECVLGVDQSLTSTGYALNTLEGGLHTGTIEPAPLKDVPRLYYIRKRLLALIDAFRPKLIVFEDYAMGFRKGTGRLAHLGEVGGVLKLTAWECGVPHLVVPNATLKRLITGRGNAKKPEVQAELSSRFGLQVHQNDEADAAALMLVGQAMRGFGPLHETAQFRETRAKLVVVKGLPTKF